jgi:HK97 family phage major capsid protein
MKRLDEIRARMAELKPEIERRGTADELDETEARQLEADITEWDALAEEAKPLEERQAKLDSVRKHAIPQGKTEPGQGIRGTAAFIKDRDPFEALEHRGVGMSDREYASALVDGTLRANEDRIDDGDNQAHFEKTLKRHAKDVRWAAGILARSRPEYESAFGKVMTGDVHSLSNEERASLSVGSNTNGGFLVPTHLDPTIILTNSGTSNVIRSMSRVVTLTEGSVWNGVTSAGVTASFDAELAEVSDDSPTFGRVSVTAHAARAFVQASIEAFQDISGLASDVLMLFADARDRLEGTMHATGSGTGQPFGIFTALDANTNVEVANTTAASVGLVDIHNVYRQVPVRWRNRSTWLMHPLFSLAIKALGDQVSASYSGDLREPVAGRILGRTLVESDDAPSAFSSTTQVENILVVGDFSNFVVVDKPGSMAVEFVPHLFNTANNLPDGRRGWFAHWRTGSDSVNDLAFRLLQDKTSA